MISYGMYHPGTLLVPVLSKSPSCHGAMPMVLHSVRRSGFQRDREYTTYATLKSWG